MQRTEIRWHVSISNLVDNGETSAASIIAFAVVALAHEVLVRFWAGLNATVRSLLSGLNPTNHGAVSLPVKWINELTGNLVLSSLID